MGGLPGGAQVQGSRGRPGPYLGRRLWGHHCPACCRRVRRVRRDRSCSASNIRVRRQPLCAQARGVRAHGNHSFALWGRGGKACDRIWGDHGYPGGGWLRWLRRAHGHYRCVVKGLASRLLADPVERFFCARKLSVLLPAAFSQASASQQ